MRPQALRSRPTRRCWRNTSAWSKASGSFHAEGIDLDCHLLSAAGRSWILCRVARSFLAQAGTPAVSGSGGARRRRSSILMTGEWGGALMKHGGSAPDVPVVHVAAHATVVDVDHLD